MDQIISNPSFDKVLSALKKNKTKYVYIELNESYIKCSIIIKKHIAILDFDLHLDCFNWDLSDKIQKEMQNKQNQYIKKYFHETDFGKGIYPHFGKSSIRFYTLKDHANIWFDKIYNILNNKQNLNKINL